jgi:protocatechuate 3,4-dioxygenase beta subunit
MQGGILMRWIPLALLLGTFAAAQNPPAAPDSDQKKIRVAGTIFNLNGEPVRKANVHLLGAPTQPGQLPVSYGESSGTDGNFVFDDVPPGRYVLSVDKPGYLAAQYGSRTIGLLGNQLDLRAGMDLKDLVLKMTPQGVITGKVLDQDGDPVTTANLQAMRYAYVRGRRQLQVAGAGTTNDLGEFRMRDLPPGRYYLSAGDRTATLGLQERAGRAGAALEGPITTYYPNGADVSSAAPIDVTAGGETRGIDIRLLRSKVYTVRGKGVDASGAPGAGIVSFARKDDTNIPGLLNARGNAQLRPDGTFEFRNIVPGTYVLQVVQGALNGNIPANVTGRLEVTVGDSNVESLVLPIGPGPEITGTVKLEDGDIASLAKPAQNTSPSIAPIPVGNSLTAAPSRLAVMLSESQGGNVTGGTSAQVKEDGTFKFNVVGAANYLLNVNGLPQGMYLKSARFSGQDVTNALIDTTSGAGGTLELVLSSKAGSVAGSVQNDNGEPLAGVMVTLWPRIPEVTPTGGARLFFADQKGGFKFQSLAPGEYYVAAWEELEPGLAQSADFLGRFTSDASAIKLTASGQETRDLKLVPRDKLLLEIAKLP